MNKRPPELNDPIWLNEMYESHSSDEIAAIINCGKSTVLRALKRHGIKTKSSGVPRIEKLHDYEWLKANYPKKTTSQIAKELNCGLSTVEQNIKKLGLRWDKVVRFPELEDPTYLKEKYEQIGTVRLAKKIGCSVDAVYRAMKRHGIARHVRGFRKRAVFLWDENLIRELSEKYTVREIATIFNCSNHAVYEAFGRFGLKTKTGHLPKGRRIVRMSPNKDASKKRQILEHRLMVEEKLGRKLTKNEHVHHINENPLDNTIDNLVVMTHKEHLSLHIKNRKIPFVCVICGSDSISRGYSSKYCDLCRRTAKNAVQKRRYHAKRSLLDQRVEH